MNSNHPILCSQLQELVEFKFHVKQKKLNHQQDFIIAKTGQHLAVKKGRGTTFSEVRQYQAGDDIRHLDWKVTARTQKAHTKVFVEENERPTILAIEQTPDLFFGSNTRLKIAQALNIGAILGWVSLTHNERVGGLCFNHKIQPWISTKRDHKSFLQFLQQSIDLQNQITQPTYSNSWPDALNRLIQNHSPDHKIFLIGDMIQLSQNAHAQIIQLKPNTDITAIHIYDVLEQHLPKLGWLSMTDAFTNDDVVKLDSLNSEIQQTYQQTYQNQWLETKSQFSQLNIPIFNIGTHEDPIMSLVKHRLIQ